MSVISITFHNVESIKEEWNDFVENILDSLIENLIDVEKYMLSEVESEMINEGQNTNLLLVFENEEKRQDFLKIELKNMMEIIDKKFGENVMLFITLLHPKKMRFK